MSEVTPNRLLISCMDSRYDAARIFDLQSGSFFRHTPMGARIASFRHADDEMHAKLEHVINTEKVTSIYIVGHSDCKAMQALSAGKKAPRLVRYWLNEVRPVLNLISNGDTINLKKKNAPGLALSKVFNHIRLDRQNLIEQLAILDSVQNLMTHPVVRNAVESGQLDIDAFWHNMRTNTLHQYDPEQEAFVPVANPPALTWTSHAECNHGGLA